MGFLVIDIGNSAIKAAFFVEMEALVPSSEVISVPSLDPVGVVQDLLVRFQPEKTILSSVKEIDAKLKHLLEENEVLLLNHHTVTGFDNLYTSPETLGMDRLAAAAGALALSSGNPSMVIDAGTCVTYEYINDRQQYAGGAISPGLQMRLQAMHQFTARLPLIYAAEVMPEEIGTDTKSCMLAGAQRGFIAEIDVFVDAFKNKYLDSIILVCGGDAPFIQKNSKHKLHLEKHLVLLGLLKILKANA